MTYLYRTGLPFIFAGIHFGESFTTRNASAANSGVAALRTVRFDSEPFFSITKFIKPLPCPSYIEFGHFKCFPRNLFQAFSPPGNSGQEDKLQLGDC